MPKLKTLIVLAVVIASAAPPAHAFRVNVPGVGEFSDKGVRPPQPVQIGPITVAPPSPIPSRPSDVILPPTPSVRVQGNGEIAKAVNGIDDAANGAKRAVDTAAAAVGAEAKAAAEAGWRLFVKAHTWPFDMVAQWFKDRLGEAGAALDRAIDKIVPALLMATVFTLSLASLMRSPRRRK